MNNSPFLARAGIDIRAKPHGSTDDCDNCPSGRLCNQYVGGDEDVILDLDSRPEGLELAVP